MHRTANNDAWLPAGPRSALKKCPRCGDLALEGQEECFGCGATPADDSTWREARQDGQGDMFPAERRPRSALER